MHFLIALLVATTISSSVLVNASPQGANLRRTNDYGKDKDAIILESSNPTSVTVPIGFEIPTKDLPSSVPSKDQHLDKAPSFSVLDKDKSLSSVVPDQGNNTSVPKFASPSVKSNVDDKSLSVTAIAIIPDKDKALTNVGTTSPTQAPDKDDKASSTTLRLDNLDNDKTSASSTSPTTFTGDIDDKTPLSTSAFSIPAKDRLYSTVKLSKDDKSTSKEPSKPLETAIPDKDKTLASSTSPIAFFGDIDDKTFPSTSAFTVPAKDRLYSTVKFSKDDKNTSVELLKPLETAIPAKDKPLFTFSDDKNEKVSTDYRLSSSLAKSFSKGTLSSTITPFEVGGTSTQLPLSTLAPVISDQGKVSNSVYTKDNSTRTLDRSSTTAYFAPHKDRTDSAFAIDKDSAVIAYDNTLSYSIPEKDRATGILQSGSSTSLQHKHQYVSSQALTKDQTVSSRGSILSTAVQAKDQIVSASVPAKDQSLGSRLQLKSIYTSAQDQSTGSSTPVHGQTSTLSNILPTFTSANKHTTSPSSRVQDLVYSTIIPNVVSAKHIYSSILIASSTSASGKHTSKFIGTAIPAVVSSPTSNKDSTTYLESLKNTFSGSSKDKDLNGASKSSLPASPYFPKPENFKYNSEFPVSSSSPRQVSATPTQLGTSAELISPPSEATDNSNLRSNIAFEYSTAYESTRAFGKPDSSSPVSKIEVETSTYPAKGLGSTRKVPFSNRTSMVIPVWSPSMLGNAYGGGFVTTPSVFVTIFPDSTASATSTRAITSKHESSSKPGSDQTSSHSFTNVAVQFKDTSSIVPDTTNLDTPAKGEAEHSNSPTSTSTPISSNKLEDQTEIVSPVPVKTIQSLSKEFKNKSNYPASASEAVIPVTSGSAPSPSSTSTEKETSASFPLPSLGASNDQSSIYGKLPEVPVSLQSSQSFNLPSAFSQTAQVIPKNSNGSPHSLITTQLPQTSTQSSGFDQIGQDIPKKLVTPDSTLLGDKSSVGSFKSAQTLVSYQSPLSSAFLSAISSAISRIEQAIPEMFNTALPTDRSHVLAPSPQVLATAQSPQSSTFPSASLQGEQGGSSGLYIPVSVLSADKSRIVGSILLPSTQRFVPSEVTQAKFTILGPSPSIASKDGSLFPTKTPHLSAIIGLKETSIPGLSSALVVGKSALSYLQPEDTTAQRIEKDKPRISLNSTIPGFVASHPTGLFTSRNGTIGVHYNPGSASAYQGFAFKLTIGTSFATFSFVATSLYFLYF